MYDEDVSNEEYRAWQEQRRQREKMVDMEIEMSDDEFLFVAKQAHERDITFNEMFNIIMKEYIEKLEREEQDNGTSND